MLLVKKGQEICRKEKRYPCPRTQYKKQPVCKAIFTVKWYTSAAKETKEKNFLEILYMYECMNLCVDVSVKRQIIPVSVKYEPTP